MPKLTKEEAQEYVRTLLNKFDLSDDKTDQRIELSDQMSANRYVLFSAVEVNDISDEYQGETNPTKKSKIYEKLQLLSAIDDAITKAKDSGMNVNFAISAENLNEAFVDFEKGANITGIIAKLVKAENANSR